ncbi:hypothetical protein D3C72_2320200 [compost metagenome]
MKALIGTVANAVAVVFDFRQATVREVAAGLAMHQALAIAHLALQPAFRRVEGRHAVQLAAHIGQLGGRLAVGMK